MKEVIAQSSANGYRALSIVPRASINLSGGVSTSTPPGKFPIVGS